MLKIFVNVNEHSFPFFNYKEALSYVMNLAMRQHKHAPLLTLKENACAACDLASELYLILADEANDKLTITNFKKSSSRILKLKEYLMSRKDKETFLLTWGDVMMSIEGKGLLHGFGFGTKRYNDVIRGNSEKISVMKAGR